VHQDRLVSSLNSIGFNAIQDFVISQVMCNGKVSLHFFIYFISRVLFGGGLKNVEQRQNNMAKLCFRFEV